MRDYDMIEDEFDVLFRRMMRPFRELDTIWDEIKESPNTKTFGPYYYGYSITVGPDGHPVVKEYGNVRPGLLPSAETREPLVDVIIDDKEKLLKVVEESVKATYSNGILAVKFKLKEEDKPKGKTVPVE